MRPQRGERQRRQAARRAHLVGGAGQVGRAVDQRAVQVEQHRPRGAGAHCRSAAGDQVVDAGVVGQPVAPRQRVVFHAATCAAVASPAVAAPAREFARADEARVLVRAPGSSRSTYSAPTIANRKDFGLRFRVEKNTQPPGLTSVAQARTTAAGSGTCSSISMQVTTSKRAGLLCGQRLGRDLAVVDVVDARLQRMQARHAAAACAARSMPVTRGAAARHRFGQDAAAAADVEHRLAAQAGAGASIQSSRSGLIWCSGRNSLSGSHQRWASSLNLASSCRRCMTVCGHGAIVGMAQRPKRKTPPKRGFGGPAARRPRHHLLAAGADHFDFHAAVLARGLRRSCCPRPAASRPCLRCRRGSSRCPC